MYSIYLQFKNCDNGGTAELFDDAVIKLLANNWKTLPQLTMLMSRDEDYKRFVMSHISATGDLHDLKKIQVYANSKCPSGYRSTCDLIESKTMDAIKTLESFGIR